MKINKIKSLTKIKLTGLNFDKFFLVANVNNIELYNITRLSYNELIVSVHQLDYQNLINLIKHLNYKIEELKVGGLGFIKSLLVKRMGIFIGLILGLAMIIVVNNFTFNFTILGLENIKNENIVNLIEDYGVKRFKINKFKSEDLEKYLADNLTDVSMVSVKKKGTTIIVNIKEKLPEIVDEFIPIYSDYNFVIDTIEVYSGMTKYKAGDIIKKGDVLVEPYIISGGEKVKCKPVAKITGKAYFTASVEFEENYKTLVRTGKSKVIESNYELLNKKFLTTKSENKFENFEIITKKINTFNNLFLPLKINKTIAYELKEVEIKQNFEENREKLERKAIKEARSKVINNLKIEEEKIIITKNQNKYYVNCYICSIIKIE